MRNSTRIGAYLGGAALVAAWFFLVPIVVALSGGPVWAMSQLCPLGGGSAGSAPVGGSVKIIGTHYDALGNATKVRCDTKAGDFIIVRTFGADPPILDVQLFSSTSACAPIAAMRNYFATFGPYGAEVQVNKNGVPKRECIFHGAVDAGSSNPPYFPSYWSVDTVRKFDGTGKPTSEKGSFSLNNSVDGQIFTGKILIKYP